MKLGLSIMPLENITAYCYLIFAVRDFHMADAYTSDLVEERKTNLMSLAILFHFLCAQRVSDINPLNTQLNPICQLYK